MNNENLSPDTWLGTVLCLALLFATGCLSGLNTAPKRVSPGYDRLLIVEFADQVPYRGVGTQFASILGDTTSDMTGTVDAIVVGKSDLGMDSPSTILNRGRMPLDLLKKARDRFDADALLIGEMTSFDPYSDPAVSTRGKLFDVGNGVVIDEFSNRWDATDEDVKDAVQEYYDANRGRDSMEFGPNVYLTSPRYFLHFVAHQIARDHVMVEKANDSAGEK